MFELYNFVEFIIKKNNFSVIDSKFEESEAMCDECKICINCRCIKCMWEIFHSSMVKIHIFRGIIIKKHLIQTDAS